MTDFVALRPKLYSYKKLDGSDVKKCKGIKKCVVKKTLKGNSGLSRSCSQMKEHEKSKRTSHH